MHYVEPYADGRSDCERRVAPGPRRSSDWLRRSISACTERFEQPVTAQSFEPDGAGARVTAAVPDVSRDGLPWAVRVYRSKTGLICPEAGRVQGQIRSGEFGQIDSPSDKFLPRPLDDAEFGQVESADGDFKRRAVDAAGSCADLDKGPLSIAVNHYVDQEHRDLRAVVFGVFTRDVSALRFEVDGEPRDLGVAAGSYIGVMRDDEAGSATLVFTMVDGIEKVVRLQDVAKPSAHEQVGSEG